MAENNKQDAIELLTQDHRKVEELFEQFQKADDGSKKEDIARQICTELKVHAMLEEEILYPALRGKIEDDDLDEAYVEHDGAKVMINDIMAGGPDDDFYDAKVKVLQEEIEHHIEEEEQRMEGLFAQARKGGIDADALGEQMAARKAELMQQAASGTLPKPELTTM